MLHLRKYCGTAALSFAIVSGFSVPALAQQRPGNSGVAPRSPGYGGGAPTSNTSTPPAGNAASNPSANGNRIVPVNTNGPQSAPGNPAQNPQLNPNLNPAIQSKIDADIKAAQQFQMQGPKNGGQIVVTEPFQLTAAEQQYIDQILGFWEQSTADITRYGCDFRRWDYDSQDPTVEQLSKQIGHSNFAMSAAVGVLRYEKPDRGLFRVDQYGKLTGNVTKDKQPELMPSKGTFGEYFICDGKMLHDYDRTNKRCTRRELPPEMRGIGIMNSPMPFLFGVKVADVKERYWVRAIQPPANPKPGEQLYSIEAYPKYPSDAVNYHHIVVTLDPEGKLLLPKQMIMFLPEWREKGSNENGIEIPARDAKTVYEFDNRATGANMFQRISEKLWKEEFIPTEPGSDWQVETIPFAPPAAESGPPRVAAPNGPGIPNGQATPVGQPNVKPR